jgi:hypothetical protein
MFGGSLFHLSSLLNFAEFVFPDAAKRTYPVIRNIFPGSARLDSVVGITDFRVILISAYIAYIFVHDLPPHSKRYRAASVQELMPTALSTFTEINDVPEKLYNMRA